MFEIVPGRDSLAGTGAQVISAYRGGNTVQLAVPGHPTQAVTAEVVAVKIGNQTGVLIYLWLKAEQVGVLFRPSAPVNETNYREVLQQAIEYAEAMGFLMDADASHIADWQRLAILGHEPKAGLSGAGTDASDDSAAMSVAHFAEETQEMQASAPSVAAESIVREQWQVWVKYLASF